MTKAITDKQFKGYIERTQYFIEVCIKENYQDTNRFNLEKILSECKSLIDDGHIDLNKSICGRSGNTRTLLACAAEKGDVRNIELLVEYGADLNSHGQNRHCLNPLHVAVLGGEVDAAKALLKLGASTETEGYGRTALWEACCDENRVEMVSLLVDAGANVEALGAKSGFGSTKKTPMQIAKTQEVRDILLKAGGKQVESA